ncbi:TetR/AcrR family transcriptional regulator [Micromonospora sp. NPDC049559]|uniref:TetR/AcrR family transcriptional regulator n=1 Tax=Micromonospora sp. NPDC049559 TaxID=3155923 RepID=UPI0034350F3B
MDETTSGPAGGIRGRFRAQVRDEVKRTALRQLAEGGPQALSVNAIAKELGVSGPALYRYFANRDELLTELVRDAYHDLAAALRAAAGGDLAPADRLRAVGAAYRDWALRQPHRYRLLYTAPLPGYDTHAEQLVRAAQESMDVVRDVLGDLVPGDDPLPGVMLWSRLHGLVDLEIEGNFASMRLDPALLFRRELDASLRELTDAARPA